MILNPHKIKFEIFDKFGNLEFRKEQLMKSFLANWIREQRAESAGVDASLTDTGNVARTNIRGGNFMMTAAEAIATYGIRVGNSNQAVAIGDYNLIGPIAHGNTAGLLYHKVTTVSAVTVAGVMAYYTIQRNFDNNSGGEIGIEEVGLIVVGSTATWYFLVARDVTGTLAVANGKTFVATYTYSSSV